MKRTDDEGRTHRDKHLVSSIKKFIFKFYSYVSNPSIHLSLLSICCPFNQPGPTHTLISTRCHCVMWLSSRRRRGGRGWWWWCTEFLNPESHRSGPSIIFQQASHVLVCVYILCLRVCVRVCVSDFRDLVVMVLLKRLVLRVRVRCVRVAVVIRLIVADVRRHRGRRAAGITVCSFLDRLGKIQSDLRQKEETVRC